MVHSQILASRVVNAHGESPVVGQATEEAGSDPFIFVVLPYLLIIGTVIICLAVVGIFIWLLVSQIQQKRREKFENRDN